MWSDHKELWYNIIMMKDILEVGKKYRGELLRVDYGYEIDDCEDDCWFYILKGGEIIKEELWYNIVMEKEVWTLLNDAIDATEDNDLADAIQNIITHIRNFNII